MHLFFLLFFGFAVGAGIAVAICAAVVHLPAALSERRLARRLEDVSSSAVDVQPVEAESLVMRRMDGPLPAIDRLVAKTSAGAKLPQIIEQAGVKTTPSAVVLMSLSLAVAAGLVTQVFGHIWFASVLVGCVAACGPTALLLFKRSSRLVKFEEMFPEALDLLSRALKAGHALQTALGMAADEMKEPVGPEFKKTFDQQNFGLPLKDALHQMTERVPILDVRFFVTAVLIQRETGGNLSEILDNLAHVVRERFKIRRQVRVHTAHGRFTAFVLMALPAALAIALVIIDPDMMAPLFREHTGQMMLLVAMALQFVGFIWIRNVIKIEV